MTNDVSLLTGSETQGGRSVRTQLKSLQSDHNLNAYFEIVSNLKAELFR